MKGRRCFLLSLADRARARIDVFSLQVDKPQPLVKMTEKFARNAAVHAEEDCPSQQAFIEGLLELEGDRIRSWKGYKAVGKGYSVCERMLPLNFKNLEDRLLEEFNRLRQLEAGIDQLLQTL